MKNIKLLSAVLVLFTAFNFVSCSDVEPVDPAIVIPTPDPNPNPNPTPGTFTADFNAQTFSATTTLVYISGGSIIINAIGPQGDSFGFLLNGTTTGTYPANSSENLIGYNPVGGGDTFIGTNFENPSENTGSVIVTEIDNVNNTISGTFQFKGYSYDIDDNLISIQFTNGVFNDLPFVVQNPSNDTFYAKVNGVEFVDVDILAAEISAGGGDTFMTVSAATIDDRSITVGMKETLGVGPYTITGNTATDAVQLNYALNEADFATSATSGIVTITEKTATRIKGTFSGTVIIDTVTYQITAGTFDVELP